MPPNARVALRMSMRLALVTERPASPARADCLPCVRVHAVVRIGVRVHRVHSYSIALSLAIIVHDLRIGAVRTNKITVDL